MGAATRICKWREKEIRSRQSAAHSRRPIHAHSPLPHPHLAELFPGASFFFHFILPRRPTGLGLNGTSSSSGVVPCRIHGEGESSRAASLPTAAAQHSRCTHTRAHRQTLRLTLSQPASTRRAHRRVHWLQSDAAPLSISQPVAPWRPLISARLCARSQTTTVEECLKNTRKHGRASLLALHRCRCRLVRF